MKVSIITACYNGAETISDSIKSLIKQDYPDIEHIVKDGGSQDSSLEIISELSPESIVISEPDLGLYDALNEGVKKSTGDVIGVLHTDDFYYSNDVISNVVRVFNEKNCDAVYGDLKYVDRIKTNEIKRNWISGEYKHGDFLMGWMPPHPSFFVKRSVIEKFGTYNTNFKTAADYEWMLRIIHKGRINIEYLPECLIGMRMGGQSNVNLKNRLFANIQDREAWRVNDLKPRWYTLYLKPIRKLFQYLK